MNKTNKTMYWILWAIAVIGINYYAVTLALWSTFGGTEESKWLWIAIAVVIYIILHIGIIEMFIAIKKNSSRFFWIGLILAVVQIIAIMYLTASGNDSFIYHSSGSLDFVEV